MIRRLLPLGMEMNSNYLKIFFSLFFRPQQKSIDATKIRTFPTIITRKKLAGFFCAIRHNLIGIFNLMPFSTMGAFYCLPNWSSQFTPSNSKYIYISILLETYISLPSPAPQPSRQKRARVAASPYRLFIKAFYLK